jgi:hypothetical protein
VSSYRQSPGTVIVNWWDDSASQEPGHAQRKVMLARYETVITGAGFAVKTETLRGLPFVSHLIVTAPPVTAKKETGFGGWDLDRLTAQRDHLQSILLVSAGQADRPQIREEYDAVCAEIAKRSKEEDY